MIDCLPFRLLRYGLEVLQAFWFLPDMYALIPRACGLGLSDIHIRHSPHMPVLQLYIAFITTMHIEQTHANDFLNECIGLW